MRIKNIQHINQYLIRQQLLKEGFELTVEKDNDACGYFFAYTRPIDSGVEWIHMSMWVNRPEIPHQIEREVLPEGAYIGGYFNGCPRFYTKEGTRIPWGHDGKISFRTGETEYGVSGNVVRPDESLGSYFPHTGMSTIKNYDPNRKRDFTYTRTVDAESILAAQGIAPGKGKIIIGWNNPFRL